MKKQEKRMLDIIIKERTEEALDNTLENNIDYLQIKQLKMQKSEKLKELGLTKEQERAVEEVINIGNSYCAVYGQLAYQQGFQDGIKLISEIKKLI